MKETIEDVMPIWMLLVASFGFIIGLALGEELSRRRCAEERIEELRDQLRHAMAARLPRARMRRACHFHFVDVEGLSKGRWRAAVGNVATFGKLVRTTFCWVYIV